MSDLIWMNLQLRTKGLNRMLEEELTPDRDSKSLMELMAQTYLAPFMDTKTVGETAKKGGKRIFADTPGSFDGRKR